MKYPVRELTCTFSYTCAKNLLQRKLQPCSHVSRFPFHTSARLDLVINTFCYSVYGISILLSQKTVQIAEKKLSIKKERDYFNSICAGYL